MLNHTITRKQAEQSINQSIQSDVVILNTAHHCHPELVSGSQKLRRFRNKFGMTINNSANSKKSNKNVKNLLPYSFNALLPKKEFAFTLAEVLITLGIIGIVAAMTIPTLISKNQKRVIEAKLKEDYSIIQQVIKSNEGNDVDMSMILKDEDTNSQKEWFETYFAPYMKYSHVCYNEAGCWQNKGKNRTLDGGTVLNDRQNIGIGLDIVTVKLNNGTNICMDVWSAYSLWNRFGINTSNPGLTFYIDSNGDSGPNVIGKDIYVLTYTSENGILPAGFHKTVEEINNNCSEKTKGENSGVFCLLRTKNNGWTIPDDVWKLK